MELAFHTIHIITQPASHKTFNTHYPPYCLHSHVPGQSGGPGGDVVKHTTHIITQAASSPNLGGNVVMSASNQHTTHIILHHSPCTGADST